MMNNKIKQFVAFGICSVIALALCLVVLVVTVNNLDSKQNATEEKDIISLTQLDNSKENLSAYINNLIFNTGNGFVKTKAYTDITINGIQVDGSKNKDKDEALLSFVKDKIHPTIDSYYGEDYTGTFSEGDSKKLFLVLNERILKDANYFVGQINENGESVFDDEGNVIDNEFYYITFNLDGETVLSDKKLSKMFLVDNDLKAKESFIRDVKNNFNINTFEIKPADFTIKAKVNRETDKIVYINVIRNYNILLDGQFINDAEFFGEKKISFIYTVTDTYEYYYAGISFIESEITIAQGEEQMLGVKAIIDDDSEYTVEFLSSDEEIVSVDEMGYVKCLKNCDNPAIITVKLKYLGETFTDTCVVNVSVE